MLDKVREDFNYKELFSLNEFLKILTIFYEFMIICIVLLFSSYFIELSNEALKGKIVNFNSTNKLISKQIVDSHISTSYFPKLQIINGKEKALVMGSDSNFLYYYDFDNYIKKTLETNQEVYNRYEYFKKIKKDINITDTTLIAHYMFGIINNRELKIYPLKKIVSIESNSSILSEINITKANIE
jgi:hypothetical protein